MSKRLTGIVNRFFVTNDDHYRKGVNICCGPDAAARLRTYYKLANRIGPKDELLCAALDLVDWAELVEFFQPGVQSEKQEVRG